ncbi:TlpA family protein disulfide reductase [Microbacterium hatanonis]|jgi:thiol-disulfide isomerase/thioredoxin|uniref:Thioredoxin family protein n=1 Tax=Microbacterium hatanonis TaxID=404366 RepID=A0A5C8I3P0_9MICO|nr:thioredoxin family protein [Microbacterium hatanonis]TXK12575.1 thioredoxin family protein [Microbacterium hatanonis]
MTLVEALIGLAALLAVAVLVGVVLQVRQGRARSHVRSEIVEPQRLGADGLGEQATLLQFSTEMCSRCPGVHRTLAALASEHEGVRHLDVDLTHRPDIARHFQVMQTPTTLILDRRGAVQSRIGGVPNLHVVQLELARLAEETAGV